MEGRRSKADAHREIAADHRSGFKTKQEGDNWRTPYTKPPDLERPTKLPNVAWVTDKIKDDVRSLAENSRVYGLSDEERDAVGHTVCLQVWLLRHRIVRVVIKLEPAWCSMDLPKALPSGFNSLRDCGDKRYLPNGCTCKPVCSGSFMVPYSCAKTVLTMASCSERLQGHPQMKFLHLAATFYDYICDRTHV
eukprot:g64977.t1